MIPDSTFRDHNRAPPLSDEEEEDQENIPPSTVPVLSKVAVTVPLNAAAAASASAPLVVVEDGAMSDIDDDDDSRVIDDDLSSNPGNDDDDEMPAEAPHVPDGYFVPAAHEEKEEVEERRKAGRPKDRDYFDEKLYEGTAGATQGAFITDLTSLCGRFNTSERLKRAMHKMLGNHLPNFPSYDKSLNILRERITQPNVYPACEQDHYVHNVTIGEMKPNDFRALVCPKCKEKLASLTKNNMPVAKKVCSLPAGFAANRR